MHIFDEALIRYNTIALHVSEYANVIAIANSFISVLMALVLLSVFFSSLRDEQWLAFLGLAYSVVTLQYLLFWLGLPKNVLAIAEPTASLLLLMAARSLGRVQRRLKPIWILWAFLSYIAYVAYEGVSPLYRLPTAFLAAWSLCSFGRAMFDNLKGYGRLKFAFSLYCLGVTVVYAAVSLLHAFHPMLANVMLGAHPIEGLGPGIIPSITEGMDLVVFATLFFLKGGVFIAVLELLLHFQIVLSPDTKILEDIIEKETEFLDPLGKGGLLAAFAKTTRADCVYLQILKPERTDARVSHWEWIHEKYKGTSKSNSISKDLDYRGLPVENLAYNDDREITHIAQHVLKKGTTFSCPNRHKLELEYKPVLPAMQSIVLEPIIYQGGSIGILGLESAQPGHFTKTARRKVSQLARYSTAAVHSRRQLQALSIVGDQLERLGKEGHNPSTSIKKMAQAVLHGVSPAAVVIQFNIGFEDILGGHIHKDAKNILKIEGDEPEDPHEVFNRFDEDQIFPQRLYYENIVVGYLIMGTLPSAHKWSTLARDFFLSKSIGTLLTNTLVEAYEVYLAKILNSLQSSLGSESIQTPDQWFEIVQDTLKDLGFKWSKGFLLRKDEGRAFNASIEEKEALESSVKQAKFYERGNLRMYYLSQHQDQEQNEKSGLYETDGQDQEIYQKAQTIIVLSLGTAKAELWLGLARNMGEECTLEHSPWYTFLNNLAETGSLALARIKLEQLEQARHKMEAAAQQSILQSLWLHELGNMASQMQMSSGLALELNHDNDKQGSMKRLSQLHEYANNFSSIAAKITRPFEVDDNRQSFYVIEVVELVQDYFAVLLGPKDIELRINVPSQLHGAISFTIFYLALSNLVANSIKALRTSGIITIDAIAHDDQIKCSVTDSGDKLPEETQKNLFVPGFSTSEHHAGMGLPASRQALRTNNGDLVYDKDYTDGTRFTITIPQAEEES